MKLIVLFVVLFFIPFFLICKNHEDNLQWLNPDDGDWTTVDSLELGALEKGGKQIPKVYVVDCLDSSNWVSFVQNDSYNPSFFVFRQTKDCGKQWKTMFIDSSGWTRNDSFWHSPRNRICLSYVKKNLIIIGCDSGYIHKSTDEGTTWREIRVSENAKNYPIPSVKMYGTVGYLRCQNGTLYSTEDEGDTWKVINIISSPQIKGVTEFSSPDSNTIFISASLDSTWGYYASYNKGKNWKYLSENPKHAYNSFYNITFVNKKVGWGVSSLSTDAAYMYKTFFYKTIDGGLTWEMQYIDMDLIYSTANPAVFADSLHGMVLSFNYTYYTSNGGISWIKYNTTFNNYATSFKNSSGVFTSHDKPIYSKGPRLIMYNRKETEVADLFTNDLFFIKPNPTSDFIEITGINPTLKRGVEAVQIFNVFGEKIPPRLTTSATPQATPLSSDYVCKIKRTPNVI